MKKQDAARMIGLLILLWTAAVHARALSASRADADSVIQSWNRLDTTVPRIEGANAVDLVLDAAGNSYVVGTGFTPGNGFDITTVKYDPDGNRLWAAIYDGPDHEWDEARGVALDPAGNVIVAGSSRGSEPGSDYVLIKYTPEGEELWHTLHKGPTELVHSVIGPVAVNENGEIFVCGTVDDGGHAFDYLTMKYDSNGGLIWTATYNGPGNSNDRVRTIALTPSGQVVVTGTSDTGDSSSFATVRYDALGSQLWASHYGGESGSFFNEAVDMAVDGSGSVLVTGLSRDPLSAVYATVKYDSSGGTLWSARYNGEGDTTFYHEPIGILADPAGDVFVTGYSQKNYGETDFATVKYSPDGERLWSARTFRAENTSNMPTGMALDGSGNLIVTGYTQSYSGGSDILTIRYDPSGHLIGQMPVTQSGDAINWPVSVSVSPQGETWVAGNRARTGEPDQWHVIKYDLSDNPAWERTFSGSGYRMTFYCSMQVTPAGHVAVTAASYGKGGGTDCMTQLFDSDGNRLWQSWYDGPAHSHDHPTDLAVDAEGNVYITGASTGTDNYDMITVKYDPSGRELWAARYNGPADGSDQGTSLTVDEAGHVIVAGYSVHPGSHADYVTIKYSPAGQVMWTALYNGASDSSDYARTVAVDAAGSVYVAGESWAAGSGNDLVIVKYSASGQMLWESRYGNPANTADKLVDLALDPDGNPVMAGYGNNRFTALKLNPEGDLLWSWIPDFDGSLSGMQLDREGHLYLTGSAHIQPDQGDYAVVKLDSTGRLCWQTFSERPSQEVFYNARVITLDASGNVYIAGSMVRSDSPYDSDLLTARYSPGGELDWIVETDAGQNSVQPRAIAVDQDQRVYVAGWAQTEYPPLFLMVQQYLQTPAGVDGSGNPSGFDFSLSPAYPNPFNPATAISFTLPSTQPVSLKIYDLLGREVSTLFSGKLDGGKHVMRWQADAMAAGIYFCRLRAGTWQRTQKLILMK